MIFRVRQWLPSRRREWILRVITRPNDRQSRVSTTSGIYTTYSPTLLLQSTPLLCLVRFLYTYVCAYVCLSFSLVFRHLSGHTGVSRPNRHVPVDLYPCAFEFESAHQRQRGTSGRDATTTEKCHRRKTLLIGTLANWRMSLVKMARLMS